MLTSSSFADDGVVEIKSGDATYFKKTKSIDTSFDYNRTEIIIETSSLFSTNEHYEDWDEDWDEYAVDAEKIFFKTFNSKSDSLTLNKDSIGTDLFVSIKIKSIYITGTSNWDDDIQSIFGSKDGYGVSFSGKVVLKDSNKHTICVLTFEDIEGYDIDELWKAFKNAYKQLARELFICIKNI
mgnify:CR=1 FL=1